MGASAGGLPALTAFFENLPIDTGMAFVVILHLALDHPSSAGSVLQRATRMPVVQVTQTVVIEANHVYVIPPNRHLAMHESPYGACRAPACSHASSSSTSPSSTWGKWT